MRMILPGSLVLLLIGGPAAAQGPDQDDPPARSRQATGVKVGEVTDHSAIVWMRRTERPGRLSGGIVRDDQPSRVLPADIRVEDLEGACPGAPGRVRLRYGTAADLADARATDWVEVGPDTDYAHSFRLDDLEPVTTYHYAAETAGPGDPTPEAPRLGRFTTAPRPDNPAPISFAVMTCQAYAHTDHPEGFRIYDSLQRLAPDFYVAAGDLVYYDNDDPRATSVAVARHHWHRMYSLPTLVRFHLAVPGYFMKDDHDTLANDTYPGHDPESMRPLSFAEGQRIFLEQNPVPEPLYRTVRWGRGVQIWLLEGRDYRTPNPRPDGPDKSIWGAEQAEWLRRTIRESDADWKIVVSPTPIVGPDRPNKKDNHANATYAHEGAAIRRWFAENAPEDLFLVCGDRHWQYHSVDPETGVHEFACGPASNKHAAGTPGEDPAYHRFHRVKGGFLTINVEPAARASTIVLSHHDVHGKVVYSYRRTRELR